MDVWAFFDLSRELPNCPRKHVDTFAKHSHDLVMTEPTRYPGQPIELPLDPWLYDCLPMHGCEVCEALARQRNAALKSGDTWTAYRAASEIRDHRNHSVAAVHEVTCSPDQP
ncbi:hypothetical protein [Streptomyces flavofungini]|nr:hypothetical protein [Streptomyces flavofungini]